MHHLRLKKICDELIFRAGVQPGSATATGAIAAPSSHAPAVNTPHRKQAPCLHIPIEFLQPGTGCSHPFFARIVVRKGVLRP